MSEVQTRPPAPRGRGSSRGGRGGFAARSARGSHTNGGSNASYDTFDDQDDIGQLKRQYASELSQLKEMFPTWTSQDLVTALNENDGDLPTTAAKISEGTTAQWGTVEKKSKDRSRSKVKEPSSGGGATVGSWDTIASSSRPRGGRVSHEGGRGGRGRGGRSRGANAMDLDDKKAADSAVPTWIEETNKETEANGAYENSLAPDIHPEASKSTPDPEPLPVPKPAPVTSWATKLFSKPAPPPPAPVQKIHSPPKQPPIQPEPVQEPISEPQEPEPIEESLPPPREASPEVQPAPATPEPVKLTPEPVEPVEPEPVPEPQEEIVPIVPEVPEVPEAQPSPVQPLTEVNLEKIDDAAPPPPTMTQASTIASSVVTPAATASTAAPPPQHSVTTPQPTPSRPVHSGVAMPKGTPGRGSNYNRRVLDQQEGVVMPSNHGAVEHATLQFGSMGLNGDIDDEEEVEQAETVSQPPQPSPIAQPVTSLPPTGPSQLPVSQPPVTEALPTLRQAPGLPVHPQTIPQQPSSQPPVAPQSMSQQQHHLNSQLPSHYNRYAIPETQPQTKSFDAFAHSAQQSIPPHQSQAQSQPQAQPQAYGNYAQSPLQPQQQPSHIGVGVSAAPDQQPHYNYYNDRSQPPGFGAPYTSNYMQQAQSQQDAGTNQQRASSGLGGATGEGLGQVPTSSGTASQVQQQTSRYPGQTGEQGSGHATPSPAIPAVQQTSQPHQPVGQHPTQAFPYGYQQHPYYSQYVPQSYYNQPFKNHQGMYGYPQAYISPQYSDHTSAPAGLGGFGAPSAQSRDGVAGLGDYSRMNTTAAQQQQQQALPQNSSTGGYGSGIPNFLNNRGLPQEQQQLGAGVGQQAGQQGQTDESLKFGENKPPTGPSGTPSIPGQPGRPGSATSNLGPQHGGQTPASMYGSHLNHGLHGHQAQSQYGVGQGQSGTNQYSMYSGSYPQYGQTSGRHTGGGWGGYGH
ncbi:hypothetical protein L873DRAFT_1793928 [Choiromyces venosus 120613-1]|uniref:RNA polymerase II degradation factor 1 n=1 Tax=Choiromyces venosus 120613-1 TaxID=1336337 RepID=A0A3N4J6S4_9PEZI|nr:hypothetical protein L873DRAFT_1793928 [Choiromyces venosus 120613-1]